jgi:hypothetical protein
MRVGENDRPQLAILLRAAGWTNECRKLKRLSICIAASRSGGWQPALCRITSSVAQRAPTTTKCDDKARRDHAFGYAQIAGFAEIGKAAR